MLKPDIDLKYMDRPYVKYLNLELTKPADEIMHFLGKKKTMDSSLALLPENKNMEEILKEGYMECEYGYCTLPNGGGYVAMLNKMPGVTYDMYRFFCEWWGNAPDATLRYRIWNPRDHVMAGYRWSCEQIGDHIEDLIFLETLKIQNLGISADKAAKSTLICPDGGNVISKRVDAQPFSAPVPGVVCHFVREMPDGNVMNCAVDFGKDIRLEKMACLMQWVRTLRRKRKNHCMLLQNIMRMKWRIWQQFCLLCMRKRSVQTMSDI